MASELESSFQLLEVQVSFSAVVLLKDQSHDHMLLLLKANKYQVFNVSAVCNCKLDQD